MWNPFSPSEKFDEYGRTVPLLLDICDDLLVRGSALKLFLARLRQVYEKTGKLSDSQYNNLTMIYESLKGHEKSVN